MEVYFKATITILWVVYPIVVDGSPVCHLHQHNKATCTLKKVTDVSQIGLLPNTTNELQLIFFRVLPNNTDLHLHSLAELEILSLQPLRLTGSCYSSGRLDRGDLFRGLKQLKQLSINICLNHISPSIFIELRTLEVLDLSYTLRLSGNNVAGILDHLNQARLPIRKLNLTSISLLDIPTILTPINVRRDILSHVDNLPMTSLDLSQNSLVRYEPGLTEFARSLESFRISSTGIGNFPNRVTTLCSILDVVTHPNLRELEFSFPPAHIIQGHILYDFPDFVRDIVKNCGCNFTASGICPCLNCICSGTMSFDCEKKPLHIEGLIHMLTPLRRTCIGGFNIPLSPILQVLKLRYPQAFMAYKYDEPGLDFCVVPNNGLRHVDVSDNQLGPSLSPYNVTSYAMRNLSSLILRNNQIQFESYSKFLYNMPSLEAVVLKGNIVSFGTEVLKSDLFRGNPRLKILDLSACGITHIPLLELTNLVLLREIDLSLNHLEVFDLDLGSLVRLELLNLSGNSINYLHRGVTDNLDSLTSNGTVITLDLSQNPLMCQCHTLDFIQWIQTTKVMFASKELLTCVTADAQGLVSPFRVDVKSLYYSCVHLSEILALVLSFVALISLATLVYCIYKKRWTLKYWLHTARETWRRRNAAREATRNGLGTQQYVYDAFVAYSTRGSERAWVHTTLREKLENEHGLRLCIHYRDFKLGRAIDECIVEAINKSRKTILVLSPEFLESGWCQFEVRMVKERLMEEKRDSFVIVIFRSLNQRGIKVPKNLVRLLERKIYVEWTSDPDGQRLFWSRLVESLREEVQHDAFKELSEAEDVALLGPSSDT